MNAPDYISQLLPRLLETLRLELREYGEMLARLDRQQEQVMARNGTEVLDSVAAIHQQADVMRSVRQKRESCQKEVAQALQKPDDPTFVSLLPLLPENQRYAIGALVRENNEMLSRVQQRVRQNHLLLSRSLELMQRFINNLLPALTPATYGTGGQMQSTPLPVQSLYEAVG